MQSRSGETFDIRYEERDGYFYAFVSGKNDSLSISEAYWQAVIQECHNRGIRRLLVEEDFPNQLSTIDIFTVTDNLAEFIKQPLKIAFVDRKIDQNQLNRFGETVAVNRGVNGRLFTDVKQAEKWLLS